MDGVAMCPPIASLKLPRIALYTSHLSGFFFVFWQYTVHSTGIPPQT